MIDIREIECVSSRSEIPDTPAVDFLTGIGESGFFTEWNKEATGFVTIDRVRVEHGFTDADGLLKEYTQSDFADRQTDFQRKIKIPQSSRVVYQGDVVRFYPASGPAEELEVMEISDDIEHTTLTLGQKDKGYADAWSIRESSSDGYTDKYFEEAYEADTQTATYYPDDQSHPSTDLELTFSVPKGAIDAERKPRVTLQVALSYTSDQATNITGNPDVGRCYVKIWSTTKTSPYVHIFHGLNPVVGGIPIMDVTDDIVITGDADTDNKIKINIKMVTDTPGTHIDSTGHPKLTVTMTMNYWKRGKLNVEKTS